jgi:hypothetical protein
MQLLAGQTSLEPHPHRESRTGRGAVREPEHQTVTAADPRASPPRSAPEDPRSTGSQEGSKQVAESDARVAQWFSTIHCAQNVQLGVSGRQPVTDG